MSISSQLLHTVVFLAYENPRRTAPAYIEKHRHFEPTRSCDRPFRDVDPTDRDTASIIQRLRPTSEDSRYKSEHTLASPWPGLPCSANLQSRSPSGTFQEMRQQHQEQEIKSTRIRNRRGLKGKAPTPNPVTSTLISSMVHYGPRPSHRPAYQPARLPVAELAARRHPCLNIFYRSVIKKVCVCVCTMLCLRRSVVIVAQVFLTKL